MEVCLFAIGWLSSLIKSSFKMPLSIFEYLLITTLLALTIDEIPNLVTWLIRKEKDTRVKQAIRK